MATTKKKPAPKAKKASAEPKSAPRSKRQTRKKPETLRLRKLMASLTVEDLDRSLDFYTRALGFHVVEEWVADGERRGAMLRAGTCELGIGRDDWKLGKKRKKGQGFRLYFETAQDVDALAARLRGAGVAILEGPGDTDWGSYAVSVDDPDGFHLTLFRMLPKRRR